METNWQVIHVKVHPDLYRQIAERAKRERRSINSLARQYLESRFGKPDMPDQSHQS